MSHRFNFEHMERLLSPERYRSLSPERVEERLAKHDLKTALERVGIPVVSEQQPNDDHYLMVCEHR